MCTAFRAQILARFWCSHVAGSIRMSRSLPYCCLHPFISSFLDWSSFPPRPELESLAPGPMSDSTGATKVPSTFRMCLASFCLCPLSDLQESHGEMEHVVEKTFVRNKRLSTHAHGRRHTRPSNSVVLAMMSARAAV